MSLLTTVLNIHVYIKLGISMIHWCRLLHSCINWISLSIGYAGSIIFASKQYCKTPMFLLAVVQRGIMIPLQDMQRSGEETTDNN